MDKLMEGYSSAQHVEGDSRHLETPLVRWNLAEEMNELQRGRLWETNGHNAKTLVKYPSLRVVLIVLKRGARLAEHETADRLSLHVVGGQIRVRLSDQRVDLHVGCLLGLEKFIPHDVEALEDSAVLLTLASDGVSE